LDSAQTGGTLEPVNAIAQNRHANRALPLDTLLRASCAPLIGSANAAKRTLVPSE
jgi:hypothetical protein